LAKSAHVSQVERLAVADKHLSAQETVLGFRQTRIGRHELLRVGTRFGDDRAIAPQVGNS
jgi:hypothetical protein